MLFGRPTNQWVGLITAAGGTIQVLLIALVPGVDAGQVAIIIGAIVGFLGVLVAFLAGQPPAIAVGDPYTVVTPGDQPNVEKVANPYPTPPSSLVEKTPVTGGIG